MNTITSNYFINCRTDTDAIGRAINLVSRVSQVIGQYNVCGTVDIDGITFSSSNFAKDINDALQDFLREM